MLSKKGKNNEKEWEEKWKEIFDNNEKYFESYKKCKFSKDDYQWNEYWTENHHHHGIDKTCIKENTSPFEKNSHSWGDIMISNNENKWKRYDYDTNTKKFQINIITNIEEIYLK